MAEQGSLINLLESPIRSLPVSCTLVLSLCLVPTVGWRDGNSMNRTNIGISLRLNCSLSTPFQQAAAVYIWEET